MAPLDDKQQQTTTAAEARPSDGLHEANGLSQEDADSAKAFGEYILPTELYRILSERHKEEVPMHHLSSLKHDCRFPCLISGEA